LEEGGFTLDEAERCAEMVDGDADLRGFVDVLLKGCDPVSTELTVDLIWLIVVEARRASVGLKRRRLLRDPVELAGAFLARHSAMLGAHRHKVELLRNISGVSRPGVLTTRRSRLMLEAESATDPVLARAADTYTHPRTSFRP
jgi:hypothetical protein